MILGEFGAQTGSAGGSAAYLQSVMTTADDNGIGYLIWAWWVIKDGPVRTLSPYYPMTVEHPGQGHRDDAVLRSGGDCHSSLWSRKGPQRPGQRPSCPGLRAVPIQPQRQIHLERG